MTMSGMTRVAVEQETWGSVRGGDVSWWQDSEPRERGECHEEGCYRGEPGHGYVTRSGEVQGSGRAGGPCEG